MKKEWKRIVACVLTAAFVINNIPWGTGFVKAETGKSAGSDSVYLIQTATGSDAAAASSSDAANPAGGEPLGTGTAMRRAAVAANAEEGYTFIAKDYYTNQKEWEEQSVDGEKVTVCDIQPGESFQVKADTDFEEGYYQIRLCAAGPRTMYKVFANSFASVVRRGATDWNDFTYTDGTSAFYLAPGDTITVQAPASNKDGEDKENNLYGKVYSFTLLPAEEPDDPIDTETVTLQSSDWYFGSIDGDRGYVNLRPNDQIDYILSREDGFSGEVAEYELTVQLGGGDTRDYSISVNSQAVEGGVLNYSGNGNWYSYNDAKLEPKLSLKAGDILTISAKEKYGMVGDLVFTKIVEEEPAGPYVYEAEDYYDTCVEGTRDDGSKVVYIDMQPGKKIEIPVGTDFVAGNYRVSLSSNGTRTGYRIYVNNEPAGIIKRTSTGWNGPDLTNDFYAGVLSLTANDTITIEAPMDKVEGDDPYLYGKLDSMTLTPTEEQPDKSDPKETITLNSGDWYFGASAGEQYVNLRPTDQVVYFIRQEEGFGAEASTYELKIETGGFTREYVIKVNGEEKGRVNHTNDSDDWGVYAEQTLTEHISLKAGDVLSVYTEDNYGMVGNLTFTKAEAEEEKGFEDSDSDTGIYAEADAGVVEEGAKLVVNTVSEDNESLQTALEDKGIDVNKGTYYDIYLEDQNGDKIQLEGGSVTIRIPLPAGYQKDKIAVFHLSGNGTFSWITDYQVTGTSKQMVEFKVTNFSIFGIVDQSETVVDPTPEESYVYEAEDYYGNKDGIQNDGDVTFCDMQPGETIEIPVSDKELQDGNYELFISSNGTRTGYRIYVNGVPAGVVKRTPTSWGAADLTVDVYDGILSLKSSDKITVEAPTDRDGDNNQLFGKLDSVILKPADGEPENPGLQKQVVLGSGDWYFGTIQNDVYANLRPGDQIQYFIRTEDGFDTEAHTYELNVKTGGFGREYTVKVNGKEIGKFSHEGEPDNWDKYESHDLGIKFSLKAGDVLSIYADDSYGMVGEITLTMTEEEPDPEYDSADSKTGISVHAGAGVVPGDSTLVVKTLTAGSGNQELADALAELKIDDSQGTFYDIQLQAEDGSKVNPDGTVTIEIPVPDGYDESKISVFRIQDGKPEWVENARVENGKIIINVTDFGIIGIVNDYVETGVYVYEAEKYYAGDIISAGDVTYIDMQPGDTIKIPVSDQPMEAGNYKLTLRSNGDRNGYRIYVNGKPAGIVNRRGQAVGWEAADLTEDEYDGVLSLKPGDIITIEAPTNTVEKGDDNGPLYGKLDSMTLRLTDAEPENPGLKDTVVLKSEDWYLGGTDGNGGVNLRSDDQIDFFIRTEEGFAEEENIYQLKVQLGGFRTEHTVKVNGEVIGTITRDATDWGVFTESEFGKNLTLKAGDILSICASDSWGTVGDITLTRTEEPAINPLVYEAEDFYENKDGIQHEGSVQYCDMQPGEAVTFTMIAELPAGYYKVSAVSNGTRMAYMVSVNGTPRGVIKRTATGWNAADLTTDSYDEILWLEPGDTVTLTASVNKDENDGQTFGKLDKLVLESASEPATPAAKDRITLRAENWYGGTMDSSGGMNIRPNDSLDFVIREQDGFVEDDYSITVKSGGFRSGYTIKVNGTTVTELSVRTCEWGLYLSSTASVRVHLKPGDVLSFYAADSWGCIDAVILQKDGAPANTSMADRRGGRTAVPYYANSDGAKASGTEPRFIFQGEGYYQKQSDNPAADLQPGQQIEIPLLDNPNFVDGVYQVTIVSCGGRDHFFVKVNGLKSGRIDRQPNGYGMNKMTRDTLSTTVELNKGDLLCIEAAPTEWGWVDYIQLDLIQKAETPVERKSYEFKAMNFYGKKQADTDTADLQPGESIEIPVAADGFEAGYYLVSATACGDRTKMSVEVNGEEVGWIQRNKNSYGIEAMVRDTMPVPVYLKPGDQLSICAPANGGWGWVEKVTLIETDGENSIQ